MKICKLKNGTRENKMLVEGTMRPIMDFMLQGDTNVVRDLGKKALDPSYQVCKSSTDILKKYVLLDQSGKMHESIKNIVQSSISIDGDVLIVDNPVVEVVEVLGNS